MALYRQGTASMDADGTVHGTDTKWKDQLALIRIGATIVFLEQPIKLAVISDIVSDTELKAISTDGQTAEDGKYVILLSDSLTVNGLAQNVAETLRYYQSKETEIANAMDVIANLDMDNLQKIINQINQAKLDAEAAQNQADLARDAAAASRDAASQFATSAEQSKNAAKTSETNASNAKAAAENAKNEATKKRDEAKVFRDEAEQFANSADASEKVPYSGAVISASSLPDMMKKLRDNVKGGFWRVGDIPTIASGEIKPFTHGSGVCGGAGDTFFAINVDYASANVKVYAGNKSGIDSGDVKSKQLATLTNGVISIGDGGTGASDDQGARKNLQVMHERQASLVNENLNDIKGDKGGFYFCSTTANATTAKNYPVAEAGCLLVQRTGANDPKSCVQTYTTYNDGRRWIRWIGNGATGTWSNWYEMFNSGTSPEFNAYVRAKSGGRIVEMFVGGSDMGLRNRTSQKVLQLRDNGELAYDSKLIVYNGMEASGGLAFRIPSMKVITENGGFRIDGTASTDNQPLHVTGYTSNGTRLWFLGKDTGKNVGLYSDISKSKFELNADGGAVIGTKDFAGKAYVQGNSLEINHKTGRYLKQQIDGNSKHSFYTKLWGNGSDRSTVIEFVADGPGWLFYGQVNSDDSKLIQVNGPVNATAFNQGSDIDLKENIKPIENARSGLSKVGGYTYTLKKDGMPYAGVIAQELMEVVPEAVSSYEDYAELQGPTFDGKELIGKQRFFQVDYAAVAAYAVQVCKEQEDEIVSLRNDVEELKLIVKSLLESK